MPPAPTNRRRWFQFGLRGLFVLVTVAAVTAAWIRARQNWLIERHQALIVESHFPYSWVYRTKLPTEPTATWTLRIFGEVPPDMFYVDRGMPDEVRAGWKKHLRGLFPDAEVVDALETWTQHHPPHSVPPSEFVNKSQSY